MDSQSLLVLVAEDDADVRDALRHVLDAEGFRVVAAVDGQHALEHLARGLVPCAVLLDWIMPRLDGEAFLRARAASALLSTIPVFVMSATFAPAGDPRIQGYLPKPFDIDALLPMLRSACAVHCRPSRRSTCGEARVQ